MASKQALVKVILNSVREKGVSTAEKGVSTAAISE